MRAQMTKTGAIHGAENGAGFGVAVRLAMKAQNGMQNLLGETSTDAPMTRGLTE